jgi:hypothetical protein
MVKAKWFKFKLGKRRKIRLLTNGVSDVDDARIVSVIVDDDGVPTGEFVKWEDIAWDTEDGKLEISGKPTLTGAPDAKVRKSLGGDLIGDLNVTVQFPSGTIESVSVSTVTYTP